MAGGGYCSNADESLCGGCGAGCQCMTCQGGDACNCSCRPLIVLGFLIVIIASLIAIVSFR